MGDVDRPRDQGRREPGLEVLLPWSHPDPFIEDSGLGGAMRGAMLHSGTVGVDSRPDGRPASSWRLAGLASRVHRWQRGLRWDGWDEIGLGEPERFMALGAA